MFLSQAAGSLPRIGWDVIYLVIIFVLLLSNLLSLIPVLRSSEIFKKAFLSRLDISLVPGTYNSQLLRNLGFKRNIIHTYGVGIINKTPLPSSFPALHLSRDSFLFVGRLAEKRIFQISLKLSTPCPI